MELKLSLKLLSNDRYWPKADKLRLNYGEARLETSKQTFKMTANDPKRTFEITNLIL